MFAADFEGKMDVMQRTVLKLLLGAAAGYFAAALPLQANEYYAGKTITLVIGSETGGGFDIYGRTLARHLGRFIPGQPHMIVQNMPGAGGGRAATYVYSVAPKDGTTIGGIQPGTIVNTLLSGAGQGNFDPAKFVYIGSADSGARLCVTAMKSKTKSFDDAIARKTILGGSQAGSSTVDYAFLIKNTTRAQFDIVSGYKNTGEITLAIERGEVDGICGWDWSSLRAQQPDYANKFNLILQTAIGTNAELAQMGVPSIDKYYRDDDSRKISEFVLAQQIFGRPYLLPPGTPAAQTDVWRKAFDEVMGDEQFLADAQKMRLQLAPASGVEVQEAVTHFFATPPALVERAKEAMKR
jgi:tripartite-type tricarboxylate transporter receptor subunit TctC